MGLSRERERERREREKERERERESRLTSENGTPVAGAKLLLLSTETLFYGRKKIGLILCQGLTSFRKHFPRTKQHQSGLKNSIGSV